MLKTLLYRSGSVWYVHQTYSAYFDTSVLKNSFADLKVNVGDFFFGFKAQKKSFSTRTSRSVVPRAVIFDILCCVVLWKVNLFHILFRIILCLG